MALSLITNIGSLIASNELTQNQNGRGTSTRMGGRSASAKYATATPSRPSSRRAPRASRFTTRGRSEWLMTYDFTALPPEDAVNYFRAKGFKLGFDWRDVWQDEHARAFTVAKAMTVDLLEDIRDVVDQAIANGIAFEDFRDNLEPILRARGWWGRQLMTDPLTGAAREVQLGSVRRLGIIYDTNLRTSLSAGTWNQIQRTKDELPYLRYVDPAANPRPEHLDWSGTVLRANDDWWTDHYPPNGWN
ncbi:MAG: phage minor head protein, partial [Candidatus Binataceae bacterium]